MIVGVPLHVPGVTVSGSVDWMFALDFLSHAHGSEMVPAKASAIQARPTEGLERERMPLPG